MLQNGGPKISALIILPWTILMWILLFIKNGLKNLANKKDQLNRQQIKYEQDDLYFYYSIVRHGAYPLATLPISQALPHLIFYFASPLLLKLSNLLGNKGYISRDKQESLSKFVILINSILVLVSSLPANFIIKYLALYICQINMAKQLPKQVRLALYILLQESITYYHYSESSQTAKEVREKLNLGNKDIRQACQDHFIIKGNPNIFESEFIIIGERHTNSTHTLFENLIISEISRPGDIFLSEGDYFNRLSFCFFSPVTREFKSNYPGTELKKIPPGICLNGWERSASPKFFGSLEKINIDLPKVPLKDTESMGLAELKEHMSEIQREIEKMKFLLNENTHSLRNQDLCDSIIAAKRHWFWSLNRKFVIAGSAHVDQRSPLNECLEKNGISHTTLIPRY